MYFYRCGFKTFMALQFIVLPNETLNYFDMVPVRPGVYILIFDYLKKKKVMN